MPWVRDDFTCIDLWRTDPTPLWITGSDSGVIEFRSGGEPEPLQAIDSGGSVEKLFGDPAHGNLIALTDRGLLCIHVALHTNL